MAIVTNQRSHSDLLEGLEDGSINGPDAVEMVRILVVFSISLFTHLWT